MRQIPVVKESHLESGQFMVLTIISMVLIMGALAVSGWLFCLRHRSHLQLKEKLASLGTDTSADATATYQVRGASSASANHSAAAECSADRECTLVPVPDASLILIGLQGHVVVVF